MARVRNNAKRRVPCAMQEGVGNSCGIRTEADGAGCQKQTGDGGMTWSVRCRTVCKVLCMLIWLGRYIQLRTIGSRHGDHGGRFNLLETKFIKHHISWPAAESNSHARSILARRVVLTNTSDSRAPDRWSTGIDGEEIYFLAFLGAAFLAGDCRQGHSDIGHRESAGKFNHLFSSSLFGSSLLRGRLGSRLRLRRGSLDLLGRRFLSRGLLGRSLLGRSLLGRSRLLGCGLFGCWLLGRHLTRTIKRQGRQI